MPRPSRALLAAAASAAAAAATAAAAPVDWSPVLRLLDESVTNRTFPGVAAGVLGPDGSVLLSTARGHRVYPGEAPPLGGPNAPVDTNTTLWDIASLTKIMGGTTAAAALYEAGLLDLATPVADPSLLGPGFAGQGKAPITVADLLLHQAGFPPDPVPGFSDPAFGCPSATAPDPFLTFSCSEAIFQGVLSQTLQYPPATESVYSDLSLITLMYALGGLVRDAGLVGPADMRPDCAWALPADRPGLARQCAFEAFVRTRLHAPLGLPSTAFLPPPNLWASAQPTYADPTWRHAVMQGRVSDENSFAMGGLAGHAGIFTTLADALRFMGAWAYGSAGGFPGLITPPTRALFTTPRNASFSPRALGWLAQAPTDGYRGCGYAMSNATFYHTGYTGTTFCADPTTGVAYVLFTDRVYPNKTGNDAAIHAVRQGFGDAVVAALTAAGVITTAAAPPQGA